MCLTCYHYYYLDLALHFAYGVMEENEKRFGDFVLYCWRICDNNDEEKCRKKEQDRGPLWERLPSPR